MGDAHTCSCCDRECCLACSEEGFAFALACRYEMIQGYAYMYLQPETEVTNYNSLIQRHNY